MRKFTKITFITLMISFLIGIIFIDTIYAGSLLWGSRGEEVRVVQTKLKDWGYYTGNIDGVYGKKTYQGIVKFQKRNGLAVDGKVGIETRRALGISTKTATSKYNGVIKIAQKKLKQWGYYSGSVDGIYGSKTYDGVTKFQKKNRLKIDGIIGNNTRKLLGISDKVAREAYSSTSRGVSRNNDVTLLAMAIHAEARGEPYVGQVAVGGVILNRVKHPSFPNSIASVIYQPRAFTAVDDGQIYLKPNAAAFKAAKDALNGWDPTGGAIYYWNPTTSTSKWIWTRQVTLKIGKHWFAHE